MPVLKDVRNTIEIGLPSFKGGKVIFYDGFLVSDFEKISRIKDTYKAGIASLIALIKEWNLTDEEGNVLPVSEENLKKLPAKDLVVLMDEMRKIIKETEKKTRKLSKSS